VSKEKRQWMALWAAKNNFQLCLKGEIGFGRKCVGILAEGQYPDYEWDDQPVWQQEVWTPPNAYHKHPCVAVLGHGEKAEDELYEWLRWLDNHNFKLEVGAGQDRYVRIVAPKMSQMQEE
jgi:hypothetical protein